MLKKGEIEAVPCRLNPSRAICTKLKLRTNGCKGCWKGIPIAPAVQQGVKSFLGLRSERAQAYKK